MEGGDLSPAKNPSSLIKNSGALSAGVRSALNAPRNLKRLAELVAMASGKVFTKKPGAVTTDPHLSLADRAIYDSVALVEFLIGKCAEPVEIIGAMVGVCRRQTVISIAKLIERGHLGRKKALRRNLPDILTTENQQVAMRGNAGKCGGQCLRCNRFLPLDPFSICGACRTDERAERDVLPLITQNPATDWPILWVHIDANSLSTCGKKALRRAFYRIKAREKAA